MPYNCTNQHGCWLDCCIRICTTPPRFKLGQKVEHTWFSDEVGREYRDRGVVVGVFTNWQLYYLPGWWYVIHWDVLGSESSIPPDWADEVHESELRVIEGAN